MLDSTFFRKIGPNVRDRYREHIFKDAKDVWGTKFKFYKEPYKTRKRSGKLKRQATQYANTTAPVLTSDLLRDYSLIKTMDSGFQIGWVTQGAKIKWLKDNGRFLTLRNKPLPTGVLSYLLKEASKYIGKGMQKKFGKNKTTIHKIGK